MGFGDAWDNHHTDFKIKSIEYEDDANRTPDPIEPGYAAPAMSVDTSGRFATHEIIGGSTVRQKIGEDPIEVSISGVCRQEVARDIDALRDAKFGLILSERLGGSLQVQFASTSTSPMSDSGAVALDDADGDPNFLYNYDISCVEVTV